MEFRIIQALQETRALAEDHPDGAGWSELAEQIDQVLAELTEDAHDPTTPALGAQRIDRTRTIDEDRAELAAAALMAVHDRPEPQQLELARSAVQELADSID